MTVFVSNEHAVALVAEGATGNMKVTQETGNILLRDYTNPMRVTQETANVLLRDYTNPMRVTQVTIYALCKLEDTPVIRRRENTTEGG